MSITLDTLKARLLLLAGIRLSPLPGAYTELERAVHGHGASVLDWTRSWDFRLMRLQTQCGAAWVLAGSRVDAFDAELLKLIDEWSSNFVKTAAKAASSGPLAPPVDQVATTPTSTVLKAPLLIKRHEKRWPSIKEDLKRHSDNGLAIARVARGLWDVEKALAWARSRGRLLDPDEPEVGHHLEGWLRHEPRK